MKRVLSVLLICALLMAGLAVVASAAPVSIAIDAQKTGDNVVAQVKLNDAAAVEAWAFMTAVVTYNSDALTFANAESAMEGMQEDASVAGKLVLSWIADPLVVPANGVVAELTFTAKEVTQEQPIELQVGFYPEGMILSGETTPMDNTGEANYSTEKAEPSDSIVIQPEEVVAPDESPKTITGGDDFAGGSVAIDVNAKYVDDENAEIDNYKVVITWDSFDYTFTNGQYWDVEALAWKQNINDDGSTKGTWSGNETQNITVTNYSNLPITVKADYDGACDFTFGEADVSGNGLVVPSADITNGQGKGKEQTVTVEAAFVNNGDTIEVTDVMGTITMYIA